MFSSILRICGALFDAFAQDFINTFCMGISRDLHEVSAPFPAEDNSTSRDFIRHSLLNVLKEEILAAVPKEMQSLQSIQYLL